MVGLLLGQLEFAVEDFADFHVGALDRERLYLSHAVGDRGICILLVPMRGVVRFLGLFSGVVVRRIWVRPRSETF